MIASHMLTHGIFFMVAATGYLFVFMVTTNPRVWGYADYPEVVRSKIPPQTKKEKWLAGILGLPWILFVLAFPIYSTHLLKLQLGDDISFWLAFLNLFVMIVMVTLGDLVVLDWLVVSKITPRFVIIDGTDEADYKDFSHHYKAHARAAVIQILICLVVAGFIST